MTVILRTHGGAGNQLFQILFGRLFSTHMSTKLILIHDNNYYHKYDRLCEIKSFDILSNKFDRLVSSLRLPKIFRKFFFYEVGYIRLFKSFYLDDYFQDIKFYKLFKKEDIFSQIELLRNELCIDKKCFTINYLCHLRLGDFFNTYEDSIAYAKKCLFSIPNDSVVISSDDSVFSDETIRIICLNKNIQIKNTQYLSSIELIRYMSQAKVIYSNDSTLAFWACILGGGDIIFSSNKLMNLFRLFSGYKG